MQQLEDVFAKFQRVERWLDYLRLPFPPEKFCKGNCYATTFGPLYLSLAMRKSSTFEKVEDVFSGLHRVEYGLE